jgi:hypothetical protein
MLWLPGEKIPGEDPTDEETSDKQMNFGFTLGDTGVADPYFYVTAYPSPPALGELPLPAGARWQTQGFTGAVLAYETLREQKDPQSELIALWRALLGGGRAHLLARN